jgi:hypothetical protein
MIAMSSTNPIIVFLSIGSQVKAFSFYRVVAALAPGITADNPPQAKKYPFDNAFA